MADQYIIAGEVIAAVVKDIHPANAHNWPTIVPMAGPPKGWGQNLPNWSKTGRRIQRDFNARTGRKVSLSEFAMANLGNLPLETYQQYLDQKALIEGQG